MTKSELIKAFQELYPGEIRANIEPYITGLSIIVQSQLASGGEVTLPGIGKLSVKATAERQGRNPATGETITIAAKRTPKFTPAKALKDAVAE